MDVTVFVNNLYWNLYYFIVINAQKKQK